MRSRRRTQSAFTNPVMVGAVTTLVILVALFLAYNANTGLPFVPTRELKVNIANGSGLVPGNDVRQGGFRIGLVDSLKPIRLNDGQVGAQLILKLNKNNGDIPVNSTVSILPRSVLGLKYVALTRGTSNQLIPDGGTIPVEQTSVPVQFDDIFKTFDPKTRIAIQRSLVGTGNTLTSRGSSLNDTIASLPRLLTNLEPVARSLSDPSTGLSRFINALNGFMTTVAPVAQVNVQLLGDAATTFRAITADPNSYQQTIALSPPTLATGIDSLKAQQPFLVDLTTLGGYLTPATAELRAALPDIIPAIQEGTTTLARTPSLNQDLQQVMTALKNLALAPSTNIAINALGSTVHTLNPVLRYLGPYQTVCNYWNYWWTYLSEHVSQPTSYGFAQRALINLAPPGGNSLGQLGAVAPVNGEVGNNLTGLAGFGGQEFLHAQAYGAAIDNNGNADCETGQRGYPKKLNYYDPQSRNLASDPHTPNNQGPTFHGRSRVPRGETFTRAPQTGPQLPPVPNNP